MSEKPIDRTNLEDVLKQIGRTEGYIQELNRNQAKLQREIDRWPRRLEWIKARKASLEKAIGKRHKYINQLENDLKRM